MAKEKIGFRDIITLAKSGWTPENVNSVLDRFEQMDTSEESEETKGADGSEDSKGADGSSDSDESVETKGAEDPTDLDEKDKKIAELEKQLEAAQKENRSQNNDSGDKKTIDDLVDDIFKDYFD